MKGMIVAGLLACFASGATEEPGAKVSSPMQPARLLDEFIIMAYSGPPAGDVSLERYKEVADAGIDFLVPANHVVNEDENRKAMELGAQVGIGILPVDVRFFPSEIKRGMAVDASAIKSIVHSYKDNPALSAYVVKDEPNANLFPVLKKICDIFRAEDPDHVPLINLFPSYGSPVQLGFADYRSYVASFIEIVEPELLSYDHYPLREGATAYDGWFSDLSIVREEARKAKIPFLVFIQSEGIKGYLRVPNRAEILWQVNTALAYGTEGIGWFCYWTPAPDQVEGAGEAVVENHYNAMIDINGKRTEVYDHVRAANLYVKKAGAGLLGWDNAGVARYAAGKVRKGSFSPFAMPKGRHANVVIGTFRKDGKIRLVISNARCEEPAVFSLKLSEGLAVDDVFTSIDATSVGKEGALLKWHLLPGGSLVLDLK